MAVPKKKVSRGRRDRRRYHPNNLPVKVSTVSCPGCNEPTRPHRICVCGYYNGKQVLPAPEVATV